MKIYRITVYLKNGNALCIYSDETFSNYFALEGPGSLNIHGYLNKELKGNELKYYIPISEICYVTPAGFSHAGTE